MVPYLCGQQKFGYVDGSFPVPPILNLNGSPNPEYAKWFQNDQLVLLALIASLSEPIIAQVHKHKTSKELWTALEQLFTQKSQARFIHLHNQLATLKKGGDSVSEYHRKATILADSLAVAGKPLTDIEFNTYFFAGLSTDFDPIVASLTTRSDPPSSKEILSHLLTFEARLAYHTSIPTAGSPEIMANIATRTPNTPSRGGRSPGRGFPFAPFRGRGRIGSRGRGGRFGYGLGYPNGVGLHSSVGPNPSYSNSRGHGPRLPHLSPNLPRVHCQVCMKPGHTALMCFHRFDQAFQSPAPASISAHYSSHSSSNPDDVWLTALLQIT